MDLSLLWKAVIIVLGGTFLLRIAGRKSISQMTLAQTVIMIGIGSLLVQPIAGEGIWSTLAVGAMLVFTLFFMEFLQVKSDKVESLITGKSKVIIENGVLNQDNLKKLRFTVDQLEMKLRQQNISKIDDIEWATLEPNGQVGFILKESAQPVTKKEFNQLYNDIQMLKNFLLINTQEEVNHLKKQPASQPLFEEVNFKSHDEAPPKHLQ